MTDDRQLQAVRALLTAARTIGRGTTSMRVVLGQAHGLLAPELLPPAVRAELWAELQEAADAVAPLPYKEVEKLLRDAWGGKVTDELDRLDETPATVGPATQTHLGERDGEPVAVTVLRPGLTGIVRADLALADQLVGQARSVFPAVDVPAIVGEVRERVMDDLDLESVASQQRGLHRALRRHDDLGVAAPVTELSHPGVLVRAHVPGTPILETTGADRARAAELLVRLAGGAVRHGTVAADLRPETLVLDRSGRLVLLEAGAVARIDGDRADHVLAGLDALAAGDDAAGARALQALGALPAEHAATAVALGRELLGPLLAGGPVTVDAAAATAVLERLDDRIGDALALAPHASVAPTDLWPLRMLGQAALLVVRLGVELDWLTLARDAVRDGWD
ncbi:AarF/UbiB family protein [Paraconexibacter algicola]|uniref:ABC1 atypical kinase-like domain-containing protein n=1 Tax=Paraconexibacter algicola TaxID=2133960 RepID=A0A2T4UN00_9ACTN|nr:AarF/UbiB family protein [Paraconexibacter algicola]PTL60615.1 hypothetical protein C7Y72_13690 [Paraconexibacter algicola]